MNFNKRGFVSIESILVVGLMLVFGVAVTTKNTTSSQKLVNTSISAMDDLVNSYENGESNGSTNQSPGGGTSGGTSGGGTSGGTSGGGTSGGTSGGGTSGGTSGGGTSGGTSGGGTGGNFSDIPNSPEALPLSRHSMATVKIDNKIYAIGGIVSGNTARRELTVLDTTTGKWTVLKPMPTALYSISATVSQDKKVIHVHGYSGVMSYTSSYTISSNTWMTPTPLWDKYEDSTLFMLNNKPTLIGGTITDNVTGESHTNMSLISPENAGVFGTGIEASLTDVMVVGDDEIYAIGGKLTTSYQLYKYTPSIDKWVKVANAPTRNVHKGYKATYSDGYIYLLGLNTFYAYDIYLGTWRTLATPPISNTYMGISIVGDYLYTISGTSGADTHVYCISSNTWVY